MSRKSGLRVDRFLLFLGAVLVGAVALERLSRPRDEGGGPTAPLPMPPLLVEGWTNTTDWESRAGQPAPTDDSLRGRWVVVDCWATWCGPCIRAMPSVASFYQRWADRDVVVMGLTDENSDKMASIDRVIGNIEGFDWPVGYGAGQVLGRLGVMQLPTLILFDPEGRSVWRGHSILMLENELEHRLGG